jgi:hypothetical protein
MEESLVEKYPVSEKTFWEQIDSDINKVMTSLLHELKAFILEGKKVEISVDPTDVGIGGTFISAKVKSDDFEFEAYGQTAVMRKEGKVTSCTIDYEVVQWLIGFVVYLKDHKLLNDFKQYFFLF